MNVVYDVTRLPTGGDRMDVSLYISCFFCPKRKSPLPGGFGRSITRRYGMVGYTYNT